MIKVSLFPMAPSVSSRAVLLVSFVSKDTSHFPNVQVALSTKLFFLRSAGTLQLCIFPLQIFPCAFLFFCFFSIEHNIPGGCKCGRRECYSVEQQSGRVSPGASADLG